MEQIAFAVVTKLCEDWDFYTDSSSEKAALVVPENDGSASLPVLPAKGRAEFCSSLCVGILQHLRLHPTVVTSFVRVISSDTI